MCSCPADILRVIFSIKSRRLELSIEKVCSNAAVKIAEAEGERFGPRYRQIPVAVFEFVGRIIPDWLPMEFQFLSGVFIMSTGYDLTPFSEFWIWEHLPSTGLSVSSTFLKLCFKRTSLAEDDTKEVVV